MPAVLCSRGTLYLPYPRPPVIAAVPETSWKQQNPPPVTPGAIAIGTAGITPPVTSGTVTTGGITGTTSPAPAPEPSVSAPQPIYVYIPAPPPGKSSCVSESGTSVAFSGMSPNQEYAAYDTEVDVFDTKFANSQGVVVFEFGEDVRELTWEGSPDWIEVIRGNGDEVGDFNPVRTVGVKSMSTCTFSPIDQEGQIIKINPV